jgi:hypothetical protein
MKIKDYWGVKGDTYAEPREGMKVGDRVEFIERFDIFPHDFVKKGEKGTVSVNDDEVLAIKLDKHHEDLETWDNEAHFYWKCETRKVKDYIRKIRN